MPRQVTAIHLDTRELDRILTESPEKAASIIKGAAFAVQGKAAMEAPVDTSALANSIQAVQENPFLWRVQDGVEYGIYQELGFIHWKSGAFIQNPFMIPAVEYVRPYFEANWRGLTK